MTAVSYTASGIFRCRLRCLSTAAVLVDQSIVVERPHADGLRANSFPFAPPPICRRTIEFVLSIACSELPRIFCVRPPPPFSFTLTDRCYRWGLAVVCYVRCLVLTPIDSSMFLDKMFRRSLYLIL